MPVIRHKGRWFRVTAEEVCEPPARTLNPNPPDVVGINYGGEPAPMMTGRYVAVWEDIETGKTGVSNETFGQECQAIAAGVKAVTGGNANYDPQRRLPGV